MTHTPEKIDTAIMAATTNDFTKTALVISKVYDALSADVGSEAPAKAPIKPPAAKDIAERIYILVDNGRLDVKGNMRRWRDSEIKRI